MRTRKDCYIMIDVECSGTRLGIHDMIQFGAVAVYGPNLEEREAFPAFRACEDLSPNLIQPHFGGEPDPGAMKVNGLDWRIVREYGETPESWTRRFHAWVTSLTGRAGVERAVLAGHGITFDWAFTKLLYDAFRGDWPCHYSGLDFKSWYGGSRGLEYIDASQTDMRGAFGMDKNRQAHDAQADADYQLEFMLHAFARAGMISLPTDPTANDDAA